MQSGIFAARAMFAALQHGETSARALAAYDRLVSESFILSDLYRTRNLRLAFKHGFWRGGLVAGLMTLTGGRWRGGRIAMTPDAELPRRSPPRAGAPFVPDGRLTFSKVDAVFRSGNATRDTIPTHLVVGTAVPAAAAEFYARLLPARGSELAPLPLRVNPPTTLDSTT